MDFENAPIVSKSGLIARKLRDNNSNVGRTCGLCGRGLRGMFFVDLYNVQYEISDFQTYNFGIFCEECRDKVFRF